MFCLFITYRNKFLKSKNEKKKFELCRFLSIHVALLLWCIMLMDAVSSCCMVYHVAVWRIFLMYDKIWCCMMKCCWMMNYVDVWRIMLMYYVAVWCIMLLYDVSCCCIMYHSLLHVNNIPSYACRGIRHTNI